MPYQFQSFEIVLKNRGRKWWWYVFTTEGAVVMQGSERMRRAAKYQADRALFLLLSSAPFWRAGTTDLLFQPKSK